MARVLRTMKLNRSSTIRKYNFLVALQTLGMEFPKWGDYLIDDLGL